ncbi:MAG: transporter substrate-binding domain-containing protein [Dehalococcoidales bacterium]|nr:transporter substrate-binding domain-containing protein [Dehalococcoidales bacterium]
MKKTFFTVGRTGLLALLLVIISLSTAPAAISASDPPQTIKVGLYENEPKIFTDERGEASGFWPELIDYVASKEGWEIEYVHGTWLECLQRLESNEIDIMPDVAYTDERAGLYAFSGEVVYTSWTQVYTRANAGIQSILDLEGKQVAVLRGSVNVEGPAGIKKLVEAFGVSCIFNEVDSYTQVLELVQNRLADAGVTSKDFGYRHKTLYNLVETPIIFQPSRLYFAFPQNSSLTPYLIGKIDSQMNRLKENDNSVYFQLLKKWFAERSAEQPIIPGWVIWTLTGIGGLVVLLAAFGIMLRLRVSSKTKELREEINRRTQAEKELEKYQAHLEGLVQQRTRELEQANLHKSQFLANMSHELRTPLNSIIGYTKLMLDGLEGSINSEQKEDLQTVYNNSKHLLSLINDLLDLSKIEAGKFDIMKEQFPVSDLIAKVIPGMEKLASDKGLELTYSIDSGIDEIYADKNKTKQVLFNLLGNAVKFTQKGSIRLEIAEKDGEYLFSVRDTGIGISEEDIASLFTSYKQVGPARLDGYEGTGLGLVISKQFIELQGGKIRVESTPGKGSVFTFSLPRN